MGSIRTAAAHQGRRVEPVNSSPATTGSGTKPLVVCPLLGLRLVQRLSPVFSSQLDAQRPLHLAQDYVVRDATARLVVSHHLWLLADFLSSKKL